MELTILPAPALEDGAELGRWFQMVGEGTTELLQSAAAELPQDDLIETALTWLSSDLGALCIAVGRCIEFGAPFAVRESPPDGPRRLEEMARLLRVGTALTGGMSRARRFVSDAIRARLTRELRDAPPDWESVELPKF